MQPRHLLGKHRIGFPVKAKQLAKRIDIALQHGEIVADEGERVVDFVSYAGDKLAQTSELLGLHELTLGSLQLLMGRALGAGQLFQFGGLAVQRFLGELALGDVADVDREDEMAFR